MTEEDAKKLRCCGPCPENTGLSNETAALQAQAVGRPIPLAYLCSGPKCMGWIPETRNLLGDPHLDGCEIIRGGYCCYRKER